MLWLLIATVVCSVGCGVLRGNVAVCMAPRVIEWYSIFSDVAGTYPSGTSDVDTPV